MGGWVDRKADWRHRSRIATEAFGCGANHWESLPFCLTNTVHVQIGLTQIHTCLFSPTETNKERHAEKSTHRKLRQKKEVLMSFSSRNNMYISMCIFAFSLILSALSHSHTKQTHTFTESLTRALLLITGPDLLSRAIAGVALESGAFTHPEATLPTGVTCLAAETPVVPAAPVTST